MAPARRRRAAPVTTGHVRRSPTWAGLRAGDPVEVADPRLRNATWAFVAHVANTETGDESIEVVGGRPGDRKIRSFRPEQVFPPRRRRGGPAPSLADAPQLPLD